MQHQCTDGFFNLILCVFDFTFLQHITYLLPEFYEHLDVIDDGSMPLPPLDDEDDYPFPNDQLLIRSTRSSRSDVPTRNTSKGMYSPGHT